MELHTFCDASNEAIGAVSYLKSVQDDGHIQVSFVLGKAKLAPTHATTTPRLELCAVVLGVEVAELVIEELDLEPQAIVYYSDSRVVLGYISNETRRFYGYVSNRVQRIRRSTLPNQWHYVPSHLNPADLATRSVDAQSLSESIWHTGPAFLHNKHVAADMPVSSLASETKLDDPEVRLKVEVLTNRLEPNKCLGSARFSRFSQWFTLLKAIARFIILACSRKKQAPVEEGDHAAPRTVLTVQTFKQAQSIIIKNMQLEAYGEDLRESDPEFHEFAVKTEISDFFISGQEKPFGDLFTKITIKLSKEFLFSRNSAKREIPYLPGSRHEILPRFGVFSKRSGRKTAQRTEMIF